MTERVLIGRVDVDAGLIWLGDPCYVMGDDASSRVTKWSDFCDKLYDNPSHESAGYSQPLDHKGAGIAVQTFMGDGTYPVYAEYAVNYFGNRAIKSVTIDFDPPWDEDEDES